MTLRLAKRQPGDRGRGGPPVRLLATQHVIVLARNRSPSKPGALSQSPNSAVHRRRTAPPARRSHSWRAIVPTAASRRCLCHALSCLAARGGRLHCPDDAQAEPREADVRRRAVAFVGRRAAGSPRTRSRRPSHRGDRFDSSCPLALCDPNRDQGQQPTDVLCGSYAVATSSSTLVLRPPSSMARANRCDPVHRPDPVGVLDDRVDGGPFGARRVALGVSVHEQLGDPLLGLLA